MTGSSALSGKTILITRPAVQAEGLAQLIRAAGGISLVFPAIEIRPPTDSTRLEAILSRLDQFDLAIFIRPSAVARAWEYLTPRRSWPAILKVAAVGQGSAKALNKRGVHEIIAPAGQSDSEALLALPAMHEMAGKRIVPLLEAFDPGLQFRRLYHPPLPELGSGVHADNVLPYDDHDPGDGSPDGNAVPVVSRNVC